jgi:quercetin dioxygenase-like cupin family protein
LVSLVTAMTFIDTNHLTVKEPRAGWKGRFFHSQNMTFAYYAVAAGAWSHEHSHPNDEVWNVIDGELEIKIDAETLVAGAGCAVVVPPDTAHSVKALHRSAAIGVAAEALAFSERRNWRLTLSDLLPYRLPRPVLFEARLKLGAERLIGGQEGERF